jgi:hypothetical protein
VNLHVNKVIQKEKRKFQTVVNVLTSCVAIKKFTKRFVLELKRINIDSFAKIAMRIISIIFIVNFVNRYTRIIVRTKMMISG